MTLRKKNIVIGNLFFFLFLLSLSACGTAEQTQQAVSLLSETAGKSVASGGEARAAEAVGRMAGEEEAWLEKRAVPVDFPFPYTMEEYTMSLVPVRGEAGQYDLRICDESGMVVQQFSCGTLTEPLDRKSVV